MFDLSNCNNGQHDWQEIYSIGRFSESIVVRWCKNCGCVVVDEDYDGRTNAGAVMKIKAPQIYRETFPTK